MSKVSTLCVEELGGLVAYTHDVWPSTPCSLHGSGDVDVETKGEQENEFDGRP